MLARLSFVAAVLVALLTMAQMPLAGFPPGAFSNKAALDPQPSGTYQGPGDLGISGIYAWWGTRCYDLAYNGAILDITDSSTGNTTGTRLQCTGSGGNGAVSAVVSASACATSIAANAFVTGGLCSPLATTCAVSCNVLAVYDQSGQTDCASSSACNMIRVGNINRPVFIQNCPNTGFYCLQFNGSSKYLTTNVVATAEAQPYTVSTVSERSGSFAAYNAIWGNGSTGQVEVGYPSTANEVLNYAGSLTATASATDSHFHTLQFVISNSVPNIYVDGVGGCGGTCNASGAATITAANLTLGATSSGGNWLNGNVSEVGLWLGAITSGNATALAANQVGYYGTLP